MVSRSLVDATEKRNKQTVKSPSTLCAPLVKHSLSVFASPQQIR